jgi:L-fucose mutarotase
MRVSQSVEGHVTPAQQAVINLSVAEGLKPDQIEAVERYAFYEKIKGASLLIQSGEGTAYGNAMFCKGVILF